MVTNFSSKTSLKSTWKVKNYSVCFSTIGPQQVAAASVRSLEISWNKMIDRSKENQKQNVTRSLLKTPSPHPSILCSSFFVRLEPLPDLLFCLSRSGARSNDSSDRATHRAWRPASLKTKKVLSRLILVRLWLCCIALAKACDVQNVEIWKKLRIARPGPQHRCHQFDFHRGQGWWGTCCAPMHWLEPPCNKLVKNLPEFEENDGKCLQSSKPPAPEHQDHLPSNHGGPVLWGSCGFGGSVPRPGEATRAIHRNRFERSPSDLAWAMASPVLVHMRLNSFSFSKGKELKAWHAQCCFRASTKKQIGRLRILNEFAHKARKETWMVARPERTQWSGPHLLKKYGSPRPEDSGSEEEILWAPSCDLASNRLASGAFAPLPCCGRSSLEDVPHLSHHPDAWRRNWPFDQWTHLVLSAPSCSAAFLMLHHHQLCHPSPYCAPPCSGQLPILFLPSTILGHCSSPGFQPNLSEGWKPQLHLLHGTQAL